MRTRPVSHESIAASVLIGWSLAALLLTGDLALADERQKGAGSAPWPARVISVQPRDVAPAKVVPSPSDKPTVSMRDDADLIARVIARPQPKPQTPPARQLDTGEAVGHGPGTTRPWGINVSA